MVLSSGGVSVGEYDYVDKIIEALKANIHIRAVEMTPGKPLTVANFANENSTLYFGLPGNPVSALVTFWRFVEPAIKKLSGLSEGWQVRFLKGRSHHELRANGKRETYIWGCLHLINGGYEFHQAGGTRSSGNLINLAQTNALAVLPVGKTLVSPGEEVQILLVASL